MKIKVCGLKYSKNIKELVQLPIDYAGFIFYPKSPRYVGEEFNAAIPALFPKSTRKVGVFVNEELNVLLAKGEKYKLDAIQLHGGESAEYCQKVKEAGFEVIKAFQMNDNFQFESLNEYEDVCDFFLFDTKTENYGGSGRKFNWEILENYKGSIPFFLSGGIGAQDAEQIKQLSHDKLYALDLNSGFELQPAKKNADQLEIFLNKLELNTMNKDKYAVDERGYYGEFGGAYIPELLRKNVDELQENYLKILASEQFKKDYARLLDNYVGRPTPLTKAGNLSKRYGTNIYLKREDLTHTGAHKINNTIGQILLAKYMGKKRIIAETGAGQHGVATATVCALFGLECIVYMGALDVERQAPNVARMKMLGAKVVPAISGNQTLKDATNEAIRDWIANPESFYLIGSVVGPHPYPDLVTRLQSIISEEIREQLEKETGNPNPNYVIACVGGGSNAAGAFYHYLNEKNVNLVAVEASGLGVESGETAATITIGDIGFIHGSKTMLMQDDDGQITEPYSISAGLDYPGVGPLHAHLAVSGRAQFLSATDEEALNAAKVLAESEGIIPALESAHALAVLEKMQFQKDDVVVLNLSGRGDKDMETYMKKFN
ncbi:bifunctional phosphoribosylanthranilate isomerase/tryptophan synthase subunit beta [Marinifilum sp. D737]|uniref:bifunctional phosphoribosylanthranilate isomerase/tryptophan synthase subunit beta n=1 Tax=Marinifilum sp. D737 TaxID=2969628 RepID=UPI0022735407|nr:bifunctional phosphoribosylanthranilate isomerase/tryptophan synthase subunit beta [Marinifilum sp. D737]MCY1635447.1 bifunctional phosphoribosylanthranilate isomerase/tryptophan synthase subunit beta [Marinifilum sp. D737]